MFHTVISPIEFFIEVDFLHPNKSLLESSLLFNINDLGSLLSLLLLIWLSILSIESGIVFVGVVVVDVVEVVVCLLGESELLLLSVFF